MTEHEQRVWEVCHEYTSVKKPGVILDPPYLLRRLIEETGELAEVVAVTYGVQYPNRNVTQEIADVYNTLVMLAHVTSVDVEAASKDKLEVLRDRTVKLRQTGSF